MFKKIMQNLQELVGSKRGAVDPSHFDGPIAMQTDWTPAKSFFPEGAETTGYGMQSCISWGFR